MYEQYRELLVENISKQFGSKIFNGYQWDPIPSSYPCHGMCMENHISERSKRDISNSDPAVLYLPLGGGGSKAELQRRIFEDFLTRTTV